jgi:hypothetical protein
LTRSYSDCDSMSGDPSLVSVLDTSYYSDTVLWNTPSFFFSHSVPIICPTADLGIATLDGKPLSQLGPSSIINGSSYSAINPAVQSGDHRIISPDPIFAISAGFYVADAYTFIAGTAGSQQPRDTTVSHAVLLQADSAETCSDFDVTASLIPPIQPSEGVITFTITMTYDPSTLHLIGVVPLILLLNATYTVDTSTPGIVKITVHGSPLISGSNLFQLEFEGWKSSVATTVTLNSGATTICADDSELITGLPATFRVIPSTDTFPGQFMLSNSNATLCQELTVGLNTDSIVLPTDGLVISKIEVLYNPLTEQLIGLTPGSLIANKNYTEITLPLGDFQLIMTPPQLLSGGNSVFHLLFTPLLPSASDTIRVRIYYLQCGDTLMRDLTITFPIAKSNAFTAPVSLALDSTVLCIPDSIGFLLGDSSCSPLTLVNVSVSGTDWTLQNPNGQPLKFPFMLENGSDLPLLLQFHPQVVGEEQDSITITYMYFDSTFTRTIAISGSGKEPGTLTVPKDLSFGDATLCSPVDDTLPFNNQSCGKATIDSIRLTQPFALISKLPITINSGKSGGAKLQYAPNTVTNDSGQAIVTYTVNDSVFTDTLPIFGTGKASGTVKPVSPVTFNNATPCSPDSNTISFTNSSCDTAIIDSILYVTPPFEATGKLPIAFKLNSTGRVPILYAPDTISNDTGFAIVELTVNGNLVLDTIKLEGTSKPKGTVQYAPHTLDFGTTSLCSLINSQITFSNPTCGPAIVDSVSVQPPFSLFSKLPLTIDSGASGGLQVQYAPDSNATDTGRAIITLTVNGSLVTDTVTFTGTGAGGGGANLLSTTQNDSIVFTRSECDPSDTIPFSLFNPGCDSLALTSGFTIIADSAGAWSILAQPTSGLAGGDSVKIALVSNDTLSGIYTGLFQTSYRDSNGIERPFTLWIAETITPTTRTMALDTTPIDFGTIAPCQTIDTTISYTNTSCIPVNVLGLNLSSLGSGFNLSGTGKNPPYPIAADSTDSLHIMFDGSHTGVVYDTILINFGTDNDSVRRIPVQTFVPAVDSANFLLRMPNSLAVNQHFAVGVFPDRTVSASKGLTSVAGRLLYPDNDFTFDSITPAAGLQLQYTGPTSVNGVDRVDFSVSNGSGIALDPATPIVQLWLGSTLTDSINYAIALDSVLLNGGDPNFSQCTLATTGSDVSAQFTSSCGDSLLIEEMLGHNLIFSSAPIPNPVTADGGYIANLTLQSFVDGIAEIELCDALGRTISRASLSMQAGQTVPYSLDLRDSPSGSYFYTIRYVSPMGTTARNGSILVIR